MNQKISLLLLFILAAALAGSVTLNIMQVSGAQDPNYKRAKTNALTAIKDIRKTGMLVDNNISEGWLAVSYDTGTGQKAVAKVWVTPNANLTRVTATSTIDGVVDKVSITPIEQKDLAVGEPIFILFTSSLEHNRLEVSVVTVGDLLPLAK